MSDHFSGPRALAATEPHIVPDRRERTATASAHVLTWRSGEEVSHMDNDDIEDAIEDSTHELVSSEQVVARYESLVALWTHRDAMMHQWPSLIISAAAAVLAIVFGQKSSEQIVAIASWRNWGDPTRLDVSLGAGMPVLMTGLLTLPFVYAIYRSSETMESIALIIMEIERDRFSTPPEARLTAINRPLGWSPRRLIMRALAIVAFSMVLLGSLMTFGIYGGATLSAMVGALSVVFVQSAPGPTNWRRNRLRSRGLGSPGVPSGRNGGDVSDADAEHASL